VFAAGLDAGFCPPGSLDFHLDPSAGAGQHLVAQGRAREGQLHRARHQQRCQKRVRFHVCPQNGEPAVCRRAGGGGRGHVPVP
nr:hypothetical protein [Tanacetum cinerariifolium]